jgi:hypothetical protein
VNPAGSFKLRSSLVERGEGDALSDIVSAQSWEKCNDAVVLGVSPLTIAMPQQQWAYGLLLPLDHRALPPSDEDIIIKLSLLVRGGGAIAVAGVDASLMLTTIEHVVGEGEATITMEICSARKTRAVLLRTASSTLRGPEVIVLAVAAYRPRGLRLSARRHNLDHDLFVVLSMPKTATQTVERTVLSLHPSVQVRRTHFISAERISFGRSSAPSFAKGLKESYLHEADYAESLRVEIDYVRALGGRVAFIVGIREPIGQTIALFFQALPLLPEFAEPQQTSERLIGLATDFIIADLEKRTVSQKDITISMGRGRDVGMFFETEFGPITGVDVLNTPIDRDRGFTIVTNEKRSILLYRFEDVGLALGPALAALTGRPHVALVSANRSETKEYADLYETFKARFRIPRELCSAIYDKDRIVYGHIRKPRPGETPADTQGRIDREFPALQASPFFRVWASAAVDEMISALHRRLLLGAAPSGGGG